MYASALLSVVLTVTGCADYSIVCESMCMLTALDCFWEAPVVTPNGIELSFLLFEGRLLSGSSSHLPDAPNRKTN